MNCSRLLVVAGLLGSLVPCASGAPAGRHDPPSVPTPDTSCFPLMAVLHASDAQADDRHGRRLAAWGNHIIVGATEEDGGPGDPTTDAGAAYIYRRDQGGSSQWGGVQRLVASDPQKEDEFGSSVAIAGDYALVAAVYEDGGAGDPLSNAGAVYAFYRHQGGPSNWGQIQRIVSPDPDAGDNFGGAVAMDGDTAIIGSRYDDGPGNTINGSGAAHIFQYVDGFDWLHVKTLRASDAQDGDAFGYSVAISGDVVIVGAPNENGGAGDLLSNAGAAYVFSRDEGGANNWGEVKRLAASDPGALDHFGYSVGISGNLAVVGADQESGGLGDPVSHAGAAYVYQKMPTLSWIQVAKLMASDAEPSMAFGRSVAISGGVIIAGAPFYDGGPGGPAYASGGAYVFVRHLGGLNAWGQARGLTPPAPTDNDNFGWFVAISGKTIVVAAPTEDGGAGDPLPDAGAAYVFEVSVLETFKGNELPLPDP